VTKPVVLLAEELSPATIDALGPDFEIRSCDGADRSALLPALADADAVLIRSATKMDAEAITAAPKLKVIARAGVGLDNVDVPAATQAGVMVVNAPTSNITSAAELAVGLMLAAARHISPASQALKGGAWKRSKFGGVELLDKTVGIVGLGRIGALVAERLRGFGMHIVAYDPYTTPTKAGQLGARLVDLDELLATADFISIHLPKTAETVGLIGAEALAKVKPGVVIVNAARGGIVDEAALADAIRSGRVGAAGLDVFAKEPCTDSPVFEFDNVVVTPHLGASTEEAQEKAGVSVAKSVRLALGGELVPDAVNVSGGVIVEEVRPGIALVEKLGRIFTAVAGAVPLHLNLEVHGEITEHDVSIWSRSHRWVTASVPRFVAEGLKVLDRGSSRFTPPPTTTSAPGGGTPTGETLPDSVIRELRGHDAISPGRHRRPERAERGPRAGRAAAAAVRARPLRQSAPGAALPRRRQPAGM
jgi:D-3-phosphoglycerate dehydrogenase